MDLVSIIIPIYNCENFLGEALESVINQTYSKWEIILVYDKSTDDTLSIAKQYEDKDTRIHLYALSEKRGCGYARNMALQWINGKYVAYLDADDLWMPRKLEKQITFMKEKNICFSCTSYEVINEFGEPYHKIISMKPYFDLYNALNHNLILTQTVIIDIEQVNKQLLLTDESILIEDLYVWIHILQKGYMCYGMEAVLAQHRRSATSLSARNKLMQAKGMWYIYSKTANISKLQAIICFYRYCMLAIWKRLYRGNISFRELLK